MDKKRKMIIVGGICAVVLIAAAAVLFTVNSRKNAGAAGDAARPVRNGREQRFQRSQPFGHLEEVRPLVRVFRREEFEGIERLAPFRNELADIHGKPRFKSQS